MKRLYKFFFLLFLALFLIAAAYGTLISWGTYNILQLSAGHGIRIGSIAFSYFIKFGLIQALIYAPVLLLIILFLFKRSVDNNRKFTLRNIMFVILWFFLLTTAVYIFHIINYSSGFDLTGILLVLGPQLFLPARLWFPFPLAWLTLYIILASRIKKTE